jgi:outer membrane murein-binding lipoprotein Lpp
MNRSLTVFGTVVLAGGLMLGCSSNDKKDESAGSSASSSATTSTAAASSFDIAKIDAIKDQFPAGYTVEVQPKTTVTQAMLDQMKGIFDKATFTPQECADKMLGAFPQVTGTSMQGVTGAKGNGDPMSKTMIIAAAMETVSPIPAGMAEGTGEKIDAPAIDGVKTTGTSTNIKISAPGMEKEMVQIAYSAQLDDHHAVSVSGMGDVDRNELSDVFVKAVNAVKG